MCKTCETIIHHDGTDKYDKWWKEFCESVQATFAKVPKTEQLFFCENTKKNKPISDIFMSYIDDEHKQHYTCYSCFSFFNRYGRLCYVDTETGRLTSVVFENVFDTDIDLIENPFMRFSTRMANDINKPYSPYRITRALCKKDIASVPGRIFGNSSIDEEHGYSHPWIDMTENYDYQVYSFEQAFDQYKTFVRNCAMISNDTLDRVKQIIENNILFRADKYDPVVEFIKKYKKYVSVFTTTQDRNRKTNIGWWFALNGGNGFWNFHSTVIGELLKDIEEGKTSVQEAIDKFNSMVDPTKYQRPTKEVSDSTIDMATAIFKENGISFKSLGRRFATLEDVKDKAIWLPTDRESDEEDNPFESMKTGGRSKKPIEKISKVVHVHILDFIEKLKNGEIYAMSIKKTGWRKLPIYSFTAPASEENDPIIYYDTQENRNPYGWFAVNNNCIGDGSVTCNTKVVGVVPFPNTWNPDITNKTGISGYLLVCEEIAFRTLVSNALFPELLRPELYRVRSAIEHYNNSHYLKTVNGQLAAGVGFIIGIEEQEIYVDVELENYIITYRIWG